MRYSIKVSNEVRDDLQKLQQPRETYNDVIVRLLNLYALMGKAEPLLRGTAGLHELERLRDKTAADAQ